jgi:phosphopantothenoylcysteine synthetase/decarboxylase
MNIALVFLEKDFEIDYIYGTGSILPPPHPHLHLTEITTVDELIRVVKEKLSQQKYEVIVHSMAVLDYVPDSEIKGKVPSKKEKWEVRLVRTPKVIKLMKKLSPASFFVGFKLEVGTPDPPELIKKAMKFLEENKLNLVIINDLTQIEGEKHIAFLVDKRSEVIVKATTKKEIAEKLLMKVRVYFKLRRK